MQLSSFEAVEPVFRLANKHLAEVLSAFEFMDEASMRLALKHVKGTVSPFPDISNMYVLVETAGVEACSYHAACSLYNPATSASRRLNAFSLAFRQRDAHH
jgi:FAD/FMN-containing dehydrogenase